MRVRRSSVGVLFLGVSVGVLGCRRAPDVHPDVVAEIGRIYREERELGGGWQVTSVTGSGSKVVVEVSVPNANAFMNDPVSRTRDIIRGIACPKGPSEASVWAALSRGQKVVISVPMGSGTLEAECPGEGQGEFVEGVRPPKPPSPAPRPPTAVKPFEVVSASADAGAMLYATKACNACHSLDGSRVVGPSFKGLWGSTQKTSAGLVQVDAAYVAESVRNPMAKIVEGYAPAMPPQDLNDLEVESINLFLQSLK